MATYSLQPAWVQFPPSSAGLGNRARDLVRVDAAIGGGVGKIARLAVGAGGMGAASLAARQALVDAIAVRLVGDDEDAAVGRRRRCGSNKGTGQEGGYEFACGTGKMRGSPSFDRAKTLRMINHGGPAVWCSKPAFLWHRTQSLDGIPPAGPWWFHERFSRHLWHLPRDYELAICWLRPSFLT